MNLYVIPKFLERLTCYSFRVPVLTLDFPAFLPFISFMLSERPDLRFQYVRTPLPTEKWVAETKSARNTMGFVAPFCGRFA